MYQKVSGQVIVAGMGDVLGIKFEAIAFLFDLYNIDRDSRLEFFEKIILIDGVRMKFRTEQAMKAIQAKQQPKK